MKSFRLSTLEGRNRNGPLERAEPDVVIKGRWEQRREKKKPNAFFSHSSWGLSRRTAP